jgi:uncharacterized protein (TIGR03085 family)
VSRWAQRERRELVDALEAAGPDAPTLCEGWTAHDLVAHVVVRERRPDSMPGLVVPALAGLTERVRKDAAQRPFAQLVAQLAEGPPWFSPFAIPGADEAANVGEFFVHTEDVRRGTPGWVPRDLPVGLRDQLWSAITRRGGLFFGRSPVTVLLRRTDDSEHVAAADIEPARFGSGDEVTVSGPAPELVLFAFGRREAAHVELDGHAEAVARLKATSFGI